MGGPSMAALGNGGLPCNEPLWNRAWGSLCPLGGWWGLGLCGSPEQSWPLITTGH